MKQVNLWSGRSYLVSDKKLEAIKQALKLEDNKAAVDLKDGSGFMVSAVESWGEPETGPYFMGNKMNKGMTKVFVQGDWKNFCGDRNEIEQRLILNNNKLLN